MTDYTVADTLYLMFTTRAFATGIPTVLAGTPVVSAYENDSATQITAGITLGVSHDSVVGMNLLTIVATGANGYEAGKDYNMVITTGTVGGVSAVGEVVGTFSLSRSAAAVDLANGTDGLGALDAKIDIIDLNVDQIETAVITNAAGTDIAADIIAVKAETVLIVADTNELQSDDVPGLIATAQAVLDIITDSDGVIVGAAGVDLIWDEVLTGGTHNVTNSSGKRLRILGGEIFADGTAQAGGNNTIQLASGDVTVNDQFVRSKVIITGGTGVGQEAIITDSVASTDTLTITPAWLTNPDATSEYNVIPAQAHSTVRNGGYDDGFVFVDSVNGTAGTQKGVVGTSTNPVSNLTDAYTIATQESLVRFRIEPGSSVTLPSDSSDMTFEGEKYSLALGGQAISGTTFRGANSITGIGLVGAAAPPVFFLCGIGDVTLPPCTGFQSGFFGTFTIGTAGDFTWGGSSEVFNSSLTLDYGSGLNASQFFLTSWGGGNVEIQNAGAGTGSYVFEMNGNGELTVNANCSATTTVTLRGNISRNADVSGLTYVETANSIARFDGVEGATFSESTDSLEAIRNRGDSAWTTGAGGSNPFILQNTTIASLASQVSFTLTAGSADNGAYVGMLAIVEDASTATQKAIGVISAYTGSTKTVTLREDPAIFTMATGDTIDVVVTSPDILNILADTDELQGDDVPGLISAVDAKIDIIDTNVDQLETAIITNAAGVDVTADVAAIKAETALIVADTNELQTDNVPGLISAVDAKIDIIDTNVDQIETAVITNAAGTDIAADIIAMKADTAAILIDTAVIGAAGAGLTDLGGMSTAMKAEVLVEALKVLTTQMTESYAANGVAPTLAQAQFAVHQMMMQFGIVTTAYTVRKLDDSTTAFVVTLNDATNPTDAKRV